MKKSDTPLHIAIIMDGNRRWARARGLPVIAGHKKVADEILEPLVEHAAKRGVKYLTLWAFSTENWNRTPLEVRGIMAIFRRSLKHWGEKMHRKGIRIQTIGDLSRFSKDIREDVGRLIELTQKNTRITVVFALNYGGRDEIQRAVIKLLDQYSSSEPKVSREVALTKDSSRLRSNNKITEEIFSKNLDTAKIPDPDLIVRPGGERRLSGFLPWQSVYSEFYFADWMMPDFTPQKLDEILEDYMLRKRRFGR